MYVVIYVLAFGLLLVATNEISSFYGNLDLQGKLVNVCGSGPNSYIHLLIYFSRLMAICTISLNST